MNSLIAYGCSSGALITALEASDHYSHTTQAPRGRWLLPLLTLLTSGAVLVARRIDRANQQWEY